MSVTVRTKQNTLNASTVKPILSPIHNNSEIGKLKTVLVHRPGKEIENIVPDIMPRLLFDEIPYLPEAQKEHDAFTKILKNNGTEVLYLEDLAKEALDAGGKQVKENFIECFLHESKQSAGPIHDSLKTYLSSMSNKNLIDKLIAGIRQDELKPICNDLVSVAESRPGDFYLNPLPNIYFTRDTSACIKNGLSINHMTFPARQPESLFNELIIKYHPRFAPAYRNKIMPVWRDRNHRSRIEGGDELVLSDHVMAIGISQRTSASALSDIARHLFKNGGYDKIIAIKIPHNHTMMHLDTVFTMINYDQFTVHPGILGTGNSIDTWTLTPDNRNKGKIHLEHRTDLKNVLKDALNLSELDLIPTGNGDPIDAAREQWSDGSNTLAIAPGVVVAYNRNHISNALLCRHGIKVFETPSSELSRGRGGPRCMTCPVVRKDLK